MCRGRRICAAVLVARFRPPARSHSHAVRVLQLSLRVGDESARTGADASGSVASAPRQPARARSLPARNRQATTIAIWRAPPGRGRSEGCNDDPSWMSAADWSSRHETTRPKASEQRDGAGGRPSCVDAAAASVRACDFIRGVSASPAATHPGGGGLLSRPYEPGRDGEYMARLGGILVGDGVLRRAACHGNSGGSGGQGEL